MTTPHILYQVSIELDNSNETRFHPLFVGLPTWDDIEAALQLEIDIVAEIEGAVATRRCAELQVVREFLPVAQKKCPNLVPKMVGDPIVWNYVLVAGVKLGRLAIADVEAYTTSATQVVN